MRKKTTQEFKNQIQTINPNIIVLGEYQGNKVKISCKCKICDHEWNATPNNLLNNHGCPNCKKKKIGDLKRYTQDQFIAKCKKVHNDKYDYSQVKYVSGLNYITIVCLEHGNFKQRADMHLLGQGCPYCSGKMRKTKELFISQAQTIHGDKYDYQLVNYQNGSTPVKIICSKHGPFQQRPYDHIFKKSGCPKCKMLHGEVLVERCLYNNNIEYIAQYEININKSINPSGKAQIDFYLPSHNIFIEYNGIQHYIPVQRFGGELQLQRQQQRDEFVRKYCESNNIKLLEIPYSEKDDNIETIIINFLK